jgi:Lsr2
MARSVRVHLTDDLDDSPAAETVKFSLDGVTYEIDLSAEHADDLRRAAAPFIVAGRRATRGVIIGSRAARTAAPAPVDRDRNQTIRKWAERSGYQIKGRGRIPADLIERFDKETAA